MKKVLFTRKLNLLEIVWSYFNGIVPITKSMIKIKGLKLSIESRTILAQGNKKYYVFTSKNAVKYFLRYRFFNRHAVPLKHVEFIAIGFKTADRLKRYTNKIHIYKYNNEQSFRDYVAQITGDEAYLYFCSDLAAVKWQWQSKHKNGQIIEIYRTLTASKKVKTEKLKRLVFMSASAVNSFFQKNLSLPENAVCFTIGEPTRLALSNYHSGKILKPKDLSFMAIIRLIKNT